MNPKFDRTFHYFRGFAIFSVLGTHMWISPQIPGLEDERMLLECLRSILFHSTTLYFIFISGYLFDYVYQRKPFQLGKFYLSKVRNVLCPYLVLSTLFILIAAYLAAEGLDVPYFINHGNAMTTAMDIVDALFFGKADITYWYIPFILSVYLVSPLLFKVSGKNFLYLTFFSALVPLVIQRDELTDFFRNYCFFYPVFILGVFFARYRYPAVAFLKRHVIAIAVVAVVSTLFLAREFYHPTLPNVELGYYISVLSTGALVLVFFECFQFESKVLELLAVYSFPLYFLHDSIICVAQKPLFALGLSVKSDAMFLVSVFTFFVELFIALGLIYVMKRILGRYSRLVIGS